MARFIKTTPRARAKTFSHYTKRCFKSRPAPRQCVIYWVRREPLFQLRWIKRSPKLATIYIFSDGSTFWNCFFFFLSFAQQNHRVYKYLYIYIMLHIRYTLQVGINRIRKTAGAVFWWEESVSTRAADKQKDNIMYSGVFQRVYKAVGTA